MPYTISYWLFKYRVQANLSIAIDVSSYAIILTTDTFCYLDCICWISNGVVLVLFTQSFCCCLPGDSLLGTPPRYCDRCRCLRDGSYNGLIFYFDFIRCQTFFFFFFFMYLSYHTMCVVVWQAIGFSGHHLGIAIDVAAYAMGATWNERHFTKDRTWKGTDHAASLEPTGLTVCIYICISIYLSLSIYICVYIYIYVYIYYDRTWKGTDHAASLEHTGLTVCIYICISISLSLSIYIHICIHIHICLHIL